MSPFDFTRILPDDPTPLQAAEARVAEAERLLQQALVWCLRGTLPMSAVGDTQDACLAARSDLEALRRKLSAAEV